MSKRTGDEDTSNPQPRKRIQGFRVARQPIQSSQPSSSQPSTRTSRITTVVSTPRGHVRTAVVKERPHQVSPSPNVGEVDNTTRSEVEHVETAASTETPPTPTGPSVDPNTKGKRQRGTTHVCRPALYSHSTQLIPMRAVSRQNSSNG